MTNNNKLKKGLNDTIINRKINYKRNLQHYLTGDKIDGKLVYQIVDGTQRPKIAHVFFEGTISEEKDLRITANILNELFCDWYIANKKVVIDYYLSKLNVEYTEIQAN